MTVKTRIDIREYLSIHIALLAASIGFAFTRIYKVGDRNLIERISFRINDPSWVPPGFQQTAVVGEHYFGDFQLYMAWASSAEPYSVSFAPNYLPFGHLMLKPLTLLPTNQAFVLLWIITLTILFWALKSITSFTAPDMSSLEFLNVFLFMFVFITPTIVDFDRGNLHTLILSLMVGGVSCYLKKNTALGTTLILAASSFKPYLLVVLIMFFEKETVIEAAKRCFWYGFSTLVLYATFEGNFLQAIGSSINALRRYGNEEGVPYILYSGSLVGAISRSIEFFHGRIRAEDFLLSHISLIQVISLLLVLLGVLVWVQSQLPISFRLFGLLSICSVAQAGSAAYQWGWLSIVILVDLTINEKNQISATFVRVVRFLIFTVGICALIPFWTWASTPSGTDMQHPQFLLLSPLITVVNLTLFLEGFKLHQRSNQIRLTAH